MKCKGKCYLCYHFKTIRITERNLYNYTFFGHKLIQKWMGIQGFIQVWFCKKENLPWQVYTTRQWANMATNMNCKYREE